MARLTHSALDEMPIPQPRKATRIAQQDKLLVQPTQQQEKTQHRQQRAPKPTHVESLLLPSECTKAPPLTVSRVPSLSACRETAARTSPIRAAKTSVTYRSPVYAWSPQDSDQENYLQNEESDWAGSVADEESLVEVNEGEFKAGGGKSDLEQRTNQRLLVKRTDIKGQHTLPLRSIIDLTSSPEKKSKSMTRKPENSPKPEDSRAGNGWSGRASSPDISTILRYSPPRLKSPYKKPPIQADRQWRSSTPPQSPSKSTLVSPRKLHTVPPTPHRPSMDAFWSQDNVNSWHDQHSPRKLLLSPRKIPLPESGSDSDDTGGGILRDRSMRSPFKSPAKAPLSPLKKDRAAIAARKAFEQEKFNIAKQFLHELDIRIGKGEISRLAELTGGVQLVWSKKLNSTAGRANWKREALRSKSEDGVMKITYRHRATIELADKVIDCEHRLLNVLAHEYCHLANFMISNIRDQPHGASFKRWAALTSSIFADRGVEVTTKHSYEISYKYAWACTATDLCGMQYERHSKSIDPHRQSCGKCKSRLVQIRPAPRSAAMAPRGGCDGSQRQGNDDSGKTEYQKFVKDHFGKVREELGTKSPMKDVMREVGVRYRSWKETSNSQSIPAIVSGEVMTEHGGRTSETSLTREIEVVEIIDTDEEDIFDVPVPPKIDPVRSGHMEVDKVSRVLDFLSICDDS